MVPILLLLSSGAFLTTALEEDCNAGNGLDEEDRLFMIQKRADLTLALVRALASDTNATASPKNEANSSALGGATDALKVALTINATTHVQGKAKPKYAEYFWPSGRGPVGSYGVSRFSAHRLLGSGGGDGMGHALARSPTWSWHSPKGRWSDIPVGTCIDDKRNIFVTLATGIRKFSPQGQLLWTYSFSGTSDSASLLDGKVLGITSASRAFALDMETGKEVWSRNVSYAADGNYGQLNAHEGVVILGASPNVTRWGGANQEVIGLNASDGATLWKYRPEKPIWNFAAAFAGDGTFVYQDIEGKAHRNRVSDGSLLWKNGGIPDTWTDGQATVGANGIVYAVAWTKARTQGYLSAFSLKDGKLLWNVTTSRAPNDVPVVGRVFGHDGYAVVLPMGSQNVQGEEIDVGTYDASTGDLIWVFKGDKQKGMLVAGDGEGILDRIANRVSPVTLPNPWGQAAIDSEGTVYVGGETGHFLSLRDANGDGHVDWADSEEVLTFETGAAFVGSSGPAMAPGMLAVGDIGTLHVWLYPDVPAPTPPRPTPAPR